MKLIINRLKGFEVSFDNIVIKKKILLELLEEYGVNFKYIPNESLCLSPQKITLQDEDMIKLLQTGIFLFEDFIATTVPEHTLILELR